MHRLCVDVRWDVCCAQEQERRGGWCICFRTWQDSSCLLACRGNLVHSQMHVQSPQKPRTFRSFAMSITSKPDTSRSLMSWWKIGRSLVSLWLYGSKKDGMGDPMKGVAWRWTHIPEDSLWFVFCLLVPVRHDTWVEDLILWRKNILNKLAYGVYIFLCLCLSPLSGCSIVCSWMFGWLSGWKIEWLIDSFIQ